MKRFTASGLQSLVTILSPLASVLALGLAGCGSAQPAPAAPPAAAHEAHPPAATAPAARPSIERAEKPYDAVPLIPREVLFGNPAKISPLLSPDGKRLAYLAPDQGVLNIWVRTVGKTDDKVVTADRKRGIRIYGWAENGAQLHYVQDKDGDENWHVYVVSAEGGEARDLTPIEGVQAQVIATDPKHPNEILVALNDRDPRFHDVYSFNLKTGKRKQVAKNDVEALQFAADHRLQVRIAQVVSPDGGIKLLHRASPRARWKTIATFEPEDAMSTLQFHDQSLLFAADNRTLYLPSSSDADTVELRAMDTRTGSMKTIASDPEVDVIGPLAHPTNHQVQAVRFQRERIEWKVLDPSLEDDFDALAELHDGDLAIHSRDRADKQWLVSYEQDDGPILYYTYDRATKKGTFLFSHRPELEDLELAEMKPVSYEARDGLTIHGYLTLPPGVEPKGLPAVISPHGGPWYRDSWGYDPAGQWLANRGYAVLQPNFRGSTGYGKAFINAADKEWGGKMQDDITDGTQWLIEQGIADPERICIFGGSYGGYATLMGLAKEPDLYSCGVDIVGVANLITWMKTIPPYWKPFESLIFQRVGNPATEEAFLKSRSPVFLADKIKAPLLIAQGANDPRVPRAESIQIRDAIKKAGRDVQYVEFADEGHGFARPENRLKFFAIAEKFLAKHIGGRSEE